MNRKKRMNKSLGDVSNVQGAEVKLQAKLAIQEQNRLRLEKANQFKKEMEEARVASLENKLKLQAKAEKKREETTKMKEKLRKHNNKEA